MRTILPGPPSKYGVGDGHPFATGPWLSSSAIRRAWTFQSGKRDVDPSSPQLPVAHGPIVSSGEQIRLSLNSDTGSTGPFGNFGQVTFCCQSPRDDGRSIVR